MWFAVIVANLWRGLPVVLIAACLVAGCASGREVDDVERMLAERFLEPLDEAGIHAGVESACRYRGPIDAPWHLSVRVRLDAEPRRVARVLADNGIVVVDDRSPMGVQQVLNDPPGGWNGSLEESGGGSMLSLVFNNAKRSERFGALGWADECAPS